MESGGWFNEGTTVLPRMSDPWPLPCLLFCFVNAVKVPFSNIYTVGQTADRLAFPHAGLGQVQPDLAVKPCVLC